MSKTIQVVCPKRLNFLRPLTDHQLIRIGNFSDGGYALNPTILKETRHLLSLGLGENWSFEEFVTIKNPNIKIEIYDHTISSWYFLKKSIKGIIKLIVFKESIPNIRARINRFISYRNFWANSQNNNHRRIKITNKVIDPILDKYSGDSNTGLKVDIEGSEWEILNQISARMESFTFIILEVHDFDIYENQLEIFIKELDEKFYLAHLHANNFAEIGKNGFPRVFELTFLRRHSGLSVLEPQKRLPIVGLDSPNARNRPDYEITFEEDNS